MDRLKVRYGNNPDALFKDDSVTIQKKIGGFTYPLTISPAQLSKHILSKGTGEWHPDRTELIEAWLDTFDAPAEVRLEFMRSNTGKQSITATFIKVFENGYLKRPILLFFRAEKGCLHSWTGYPIKPKELVRKGVLVK